MITSHFPKHLLAIPVLGAAALPYLPPIGALLLLLFGLILLFFRDPPRVPEGPGLVSPADGRVTYLDRDGDEVVLSIFMRLRDVHVNRVPLGGEVLSVEHRPGRFAPAFRDTSENERNVLEVETDWGVVEVEQVAGVFARRIRCFLEEGDEAERGERLGLIAFSSRVNLRIQDDRRYAVEVEEGDTVKAGETVLIRRGRD